MRGGGSAEQVVRGRRGGREENRVGGRLHRRHERDEEKRREERPRELADRGREEGLWRTADSEGDTGERDDRHRGPESELARCGTEGGAARRRRVPGRQELGPDVAPDRVGQADEDEERAGVGPAETGSDGEDEELLGPARPRQRRERERKRDADDADEHQAELEDVGPHDGTLPSEARVGDEERGGGDEDGGAVPVGQRGDDGLGGLREEREPDDLREDDEERGDPPHALPVETADDGGERHLSRLADLAGEEEPEAQEPERPGEVEPEAGQAAGGHEGCQDQGGRAADRRGGEGGPGREEAERTVSEEERLGRAGGAARGEEPDQEYGGAVGQERRDQRALLRVTILA